MIPFYYSLLERGWYYDLVVMADEELSLLSASTKGLDKAGRVRF